VGGATEPDQHQPFRYNPLSLLHELWKVSIWVYGSTTRVLWVYDTAVFLSRISSARRKSWAFKIAAMHSASGHWCIFAFVSKHHPVS